MREQPRNGVEAVNVSGTIGVNAPGLYTVVWLAEFANSTVRSRPLLEVEDGNVVVLSLFDIRWA